jgi:SPASM domain peptide maturase of grasp-with-spasm system
MRNLQFKLFQCCIPVKGIKNGIIIDFQRKIIHKVPNPVIDILEEYLKKNIYELFKDYNSSSEILKLYIRYFLENELIILSNEIDSYPAINDEFFQPVILDSMFLEIDTVTFHLENFLRLELNKLGLNYLKIILRNNDISNVHKILSALEVSKIKAIVLYLEYSEDILLQLESTVINDPRVLNVVFFNFNHQIDKLVFSEKFIFEELPIEEILYENKIRDLNSFVLDIDLYHEALNFNLMFNKSVFIDLFGNIKRHKEDINNYGNIQKNEIDKIVNKEDFKLFWKISKDQIEICKDCEFRYICPDNRIPYKSNLKALNYDLKSTCNYDPYEGKWNQ